MESKPIRVDRTQWFMLYFQADGLCNALRLLAQTNQSPGNATIELLKALKAESEVIGNGKAFERLPDIGQGSSLSDMLVAAEVIRSTMLAFLSPEELEDQRRAMGFPTSS